MLFDTKHVVALDYTPRYPSSPLRRLPDLGAHREANLKTCLSRRKLPSPCPAAHSRPIHLLPHPLRPLDASLPPLYPLLDILASFSSRHIWYYTTVLPAKLRQYSITRLVFDEAIPNPDGDMGI